MGSVSGRVVLFLAGFLASVPMSNIYGDGIVQTRVVQDDQGKFWFERDGERFLSIGVNHIDDHSYNAPEGSVYYDPLAREFEGSVVKWRESTFALLNRAGMNTIGAWSAPELNDGTFYETPIIYVAGYAKERVISGLLPGFEDDVRAKTRSVIDAMEDTSGIIGVFLDNEMAWYGKSPWDPNPRYTILEEVMTLPPGNPERGAAISFLKARHEDLATFTRDWDLDPAPSSWSSLEADVLRLSRTEAAMADREAFLTECAEKFFERATRVVREELPGVPILGTRFAGNAPDAVIRATGKYCDVISVNIYRPVPEADLFLLSRYWLLGGKPLMITEYSWRGAENQSGNPNTGGAGSVVPTQKERAANYSAFVSDTMSYPMVIGMHWFEWADQSPQGRFDGENSNYGMVDIYHRPYDALIAAMGKTNAALVELHGTSSRTAPTKMPEPPAVVVEPGQFPDRPATLDLLKEEPLMAHTPFGADDATVEVKVEAGALLLTIDTGNEWGCGVSINGPRRLASGGEGSTATDLDGYSRIIIEGEFPKGLEMTLIVDESAVGPPGSSSFESSAGDDGESFSFAPVITEGGAERFEYDLQDIQARYEWGNQAGNKRLELGALRGVALSFPGGLGKEVVRLHSVRFVK